MTTCDVEWSSNKKLIALSTEKPLRRCVPKNFPYLVVEWEGGGLLHVVEEEKGIQKNFLVEVVAGMLRDDADADSDVDAAAGLKDSANTGDIFDDLESLKRSWNTVVAVFS